MSVSEYIDKHPLSDTQIARNEQTELAHKVTAHDSDQVLDSFFSTHGRLLKLGVCEPCVSIVKSSTSYVWLHTLFFLLWVSPKWI